ncbi:glycosyltransferase family 4 protein [Clostridium sp. KNHs205]|jgi:glycosyltransferase involved in cell wall biosynthesis|uniref:glycosyltransferase family 4 protein n=1 Tax=Clostridium sp. KNHs205 TaxID=1449050 RepID=UPI00051C57AA|nr:glycosyltransferase family 4 protein [Clostridium sp. KNHs205]
MNKILIISTISGFLKQFESNNVSVLKNLNYEIHYATNIKNPVYGENKDLENMDVKLHQIDFVRSPYRIYENIKAFLQLRKLIKNEKYDIIHCHTPMGAALGRIAARACGIKNVIYTAHGLHFYKGGPILSWIIYYPIEKYLSRYTDTIITINDEDYNIVKKFHSNKVIKINGVGLNIENYRNININKIKKCSSLNVDPTKFLMCSVGEVNKNKNHIVILKALRSMNDNNIIYLICGSGKRLDYLKKIANRYNIQNNVKFLGHRQDIAEILSVSDCFAFPSKREGLGMAALEAMAAGLPLLVSDSRGTREYSINGKTGFVYNYNDYYGFANGIKILKRDLILRKTIGNYNKIVVERFNSDQVINVMEKLYRSFSL